MKTLRGLPLVAAALIGCGGPTGTADVPAASASRLVPARPDVYMFAANKISASGRITVYGWSFSDSAVEGYLLTPTACPE